jgi:3-hydroxy-D-aspartate aldolase
VKTEELDTPVLTIDTDALDRNIACMKEMTEAAGVSYRPHAKTHKSAAIARMQIDAGAVGVCCAKLGEAEVLASEGIDNILITTPVVGESKIGRLLAARNMAQISVVADNEDNINMLGSMAQLGGVVLDVLIEVDIGQGRCGVPPGPEAARLARIVAGHQCLNFAGLQGYQGKIQMTVDPSERAGLHVGIRTGGGTGSSPFDLDRGLLTEIQTGSYVFMDSRYGSIGWPGANAPPFENALHILTAVVSKPAPDRAIVDAGLKSASNDHGPPAVVGIEGCVFEYGGDEHGILRMEDGGEVPLNVGDKLLLTPSHCDTTINLYDQYIVLKDDEVIDVWPIDTRGCVQ